MSKVVLREEADKVQDRYDDLFISLKNKNDYRKVLILVEGIDDLYIYGLVLDEAKTVFDNSCKENGGCTTLLQMLRKLNESPFVIKKQRVLHLAIKDADFERMNDALQDDDNLLYADCHDNEMMAIHAPHVKECLCRVLGIKEDTSEEICNQIFLELRVLSLFKWHNSKDKLGANFKKLDIMGFTEDFLSNSEKILNHVNDRSDNSRATIEGLNAFLAANEDVDDFYELTNGHDFVLRLCAYMKKHYKKQISESEMEYYLQSQLIPAKFKGTALYSAICKWEDVNDIFILKQH